MIFPGSTVIKLWLTMIECVLQGLGDCEYTDSTEVFFRDLRKTDRFEWV